MNKRKLCLITPSLRMGGMERVLSLIANYAISKEYLVFIICLIEKKVEYPLDPAIKIYEPTFQYKKGLKNKISVFIYLFKTLKNIKPNTALCFSEVFNPLSIIAARCASVRIFISDRSNPYKELRRSVMWVRKLTYPMANGMVAQTDLAKDLALKRNYNKNITVIPNPLRKINDTHQKTYNKKIISVGRLVKTKKFDELIEIFNSMTNKEGWELIILGDGPEKNFLKKKIDTLGLSNTVKLPGAVEDVDYYFSQSSIFAFTSISEGFPNALSEAMAFPLACIAYDCPAGPADIIQHNINGLLIPINDKQEFKTQLQKMVISEEIQIKFRKNASKNRCLFSYEKISEAYLSFIK